MNSVLVDLKKKIKNFFFILKQFGQGNKIHPGRALNDLLQYLLPLRGYYFRAGIYCIFFSSDPNQYLGQTLGHEEEEEEGEGWGDGRLKRERKVVFLSIQN